MANVILVGDFETTTKVNDCRVWASCLVHVESGKVVHLENNIQETFNYLKELSKYTSITVYYHNLKFDGEFWLHYLMNNGFTYNDELNTKNSFKTLITDTGAFYQIVFKFNKGKNANKITLLDSLKVLPLPVKVLAKSFNLKIEKGEIDYDKERPIGYQITKEEENYIINDCQIVAQCLKQNFNEGLEKMTIASNALGSYKELIGVEEFRHRFPLVNKEYALTEKYPSIKTDDDFFRKSYKGGYTYVNEKFKDIDIKQDGLTYDVNSLYPSVMYNDVLPYGQPIYYKGEYKDNKNYPLYIQHIKCKFKLKKGFIPTIQIKGNSRFGETEYLKTSGAEEVDLYLTSIDLEMVKKHYNLRMVKYIDGYMFKGCVGMFKEYINYWKEIKENSTGGKRQIAKLMLNSLYGKFAQSPNGCLKQPSLDLENITKMEVVEGEERETLFTAMACFITAYARRVTINAFQENIDRCCYCDTDSIHLVGLEVPNIDIDDNKIGAWKLEGQWNRAKFIRAKTYLEVFDKNKSKIKLDNIMYSHIDVKCAGMPQNLKNKVHLSNFKVGLSLEGKKVPKRVKGGVVLINTVFTIK